MAIQLTIHALYNYMLSENNYSSLTWPLLVKPYIQCVDVISSLPPQLVELHSRPHC